MNPDTLDKKPVNFNTGIKLKPLIAFSCTSLWTVLDCQLELTLLVFCLNPPNRLFARLRLFTTRTRIHFVFSFIFKFVNPIEV